MGNCPFFLEVHCEAHEIPELVRAPLSLSPPSRPWTEGPGSTPGSWHQWLQGGWGTMSTPRGASQRHGVPCGHPGSSLSDCGSSLDILKRHFSGPRLGPQFTRGENCPPQMSLCSSLSDWGGGRGAYGFVEGWPGPWPAAFPKIMDAHRFAIPSLLVAPKMDLEKARALDQDF